MTEGAERGKRVDLDAAQVASILKLADLAAVTDGVAPLSEHVPCICATSSCATTR